MTPETDQQRIQREHRETEATGAEWGNYADEYLVGYVAQNRPAQFHTPAIAEITRRQIVATRAFSVESGKQAATMIRLTRWIIGLTWALIFLTVVVGAIAVLQLMVMLKGGA
jgi:hypothetical protein